MTIIKHRYTGAVLHEGPGTLQEELQKAIASGCDLRGADLRDAFLRGAFLNNAFLSNADLRGADLRDAFLNNAFLNNAFLRGADLHGAFLRGAFLRGAFLNNAFLSNADLRGADLRDAFLNNAFLNNAFLSGADLRGAKNIICLPIGDPRGYRPVAIWFGDHWIIYSGCRRFTVDESRTHWGAGYKGERSTGDQYLAAMDWLESQPVSVDDSKDAS